MKWDINTEALKEPFANYDWSDPDFCYQMVHLAKQGLWANETGQPALASVFAYVKTCHGKPDEVKLLQVIREALSSYPSN